VKLEGLIDAAEERRLLEYISLSVSHSQIAKMEPVLMYKQSIFKHTFDPNPKQYSSEQDFDSFSQMGVRMRPARKVSGMLLQRKITISNGRWKNRLR